LNISYLITGGAGFIGANLVRHLLGPGSSIRILDNLSAGRAGDLEGLPVELVVGDIRDEGLAAQAVADRDVVIHLAAHTNVVQSVADPALSLDVNVRGLFNLLRASVAAGVRRFLFASTGGAIVGEVEPPVHEEMAPHPLSPYGASKLAGEGYCSAFWGSYGLRTVSLRFSNIYGPFSYHKGSVIAKFFRQVQAGQPLTVFGDGAQSRDFLYVGDLCRAIAAAVMADAPFGQAIQLGSGTETSINALVELMRQVVGEDRFPEVNYAPPRPGEVRRNFVSIARARRLLGFAPTTDLAAGLRQTLAWFEEQGQI